MALPIFMTTLKEFSLMQTSWSSQLDPFLNAPVNNGLLLKSIVLTTGSNKVNHLLSRNLQGWFVVRQRASASIYDTQDSNSTPALTLALTSSANVTVDLWVF